MEWNRMIGMIGMADDIHPNYYSLPEPKSFREMKDMAEKLCQNQPFVRIDFYEVNAHPYFGEITFYPTSGFGEFRPDEWNIKLGEMVNIKLNPKIIV
jgi:hypothetical protein